MGVSINEEELQVEITRITFAGAQDRVAVGPMSPTIELASSNFHMASQRPEVQIGAAGFGARLAQ
jgi:hypothetical protein